jgi:xanthine dehydrogenase accessory factor
VESAVYALAREVISDGHPVLQRYGVSDNDAFAVGLTCGGILDVFVEKVSQQTFPELADVAADIQAGRPVAIATVVEHPDARRVGRRMIVARPMTPKSSVWLEVRELMPLWRTTSAACSRQARLSSSPTALTVSGAARDARARGQLCAPAPNGGFGAIDFAAAVARLGSFLGYRVTVCDARPVFATRTRFPDAHEVVVDWPHRYLAAEVEAGRIDGRTVICVFTHDPKFDVPVLEIALRLTQAGYVGAMGSRKTHEERLQRLREAGLTEVELARLSSPIGLDLGARTPEETAVSIAAEIVGQRWRGHGGRLAELSGRIHHAAS